MAMKPPFECHLSANQILKALLGSTHISGPIFILTCRYISLYYDVVHVLVSKAHCLPELCVTSVFGALLVVSCLHLFLHLYSFDLFLVKADV